MNKVVPIAAVPRSGSTLLMHLLDQNPAFDIGPVSELSTLLCYIREFAEKTTTTSHLPKELFHECIIDFCREGTKSWVDNLSKKNNIFLDKHRYWLYQYKFIFTLFPEMKMIVPIRNLFGVVNSFEKIANKDITVDPKQMYDTLSDNFHHQRIMHHLNEWYLKDTLVCIKELLEVPNKYHDNIMFIRYEDLTSDPESCMKSIYHFLEMDEFKHDFDNIHQDPSDVKNYHLPYGNHRIDNKMHAPSDNEYLTEEMKQLIQLEHRWYYEYFYPESLSS